MALPIIGPIFEVVGNLVGIGRDWLKGKRDRQQAKLEAEIAIEHGRARHAAKMAENGQMIDASVDQINASNADRSWKDEWLLLLWSAPLILSMTPWEWAHDSSERFFATISQAPDWYTVAWGVMIGAAYGYRKIVEFFSNRKDKQ